MNLSYIILLYFLLVAQARSGYKVRFSTYVHLFSKLQELLSILICAVKFVKGEHRANIMWEMVGIMVWGRDKVGKG